MCNGSLCFCALLSLCVVFFFFQAEDGIRARDVTGVQTYALPISQLGLQRAAHQDDEAGQLEERAEAARREIEELAVRAAEQSAAIEELGGQLARLEEEAEQSQGAYAGKQTEHDELRASL